MNNIRRNNPQQGVYVCMYIFVCIYMCVCTCVYMYIYGWFFSALVIYIFNWFLFMIDPEGQDKYLISDTQLAFYQFWKINNVI